MAVDEEYLNDLLRYDFTSTKKGRGYSSLLVQRKQKGYNQAQQRVNEVPQHQIPSNQEEVLLRPQGVMDVARWHDQLSAS